MMQKIGKRFFILNIMIVIFCFLLLNYNNKSVNAASVPEDGTRYTVLVIDLSGSMAGTPLNAAKKSAKKFCATMMSSEAKNYIAIISYKSSAQINLEFTDDLNIINTTIDRFSASGGTNINQALLKAESMIDQLPFSVTKNVVLLSDGLPESGIYSEEGPYSALDHSSYEYGNSVYNTASMLQSKCNIYTLGFFHSSTGNDRIFGQKLLKDVQNKGYYDVQNPDDLEFVFGELADTITDSTMKKLWVQQHKQYIESEQYRKEIINGYSDYLYDIAKYDTGNAKVTTYNTLNTMKKYLGKENWGYKDEYEFILAQLMFNENGYKGIQENFTVNMLQNFSKGGKYIIEFLEKAIGEGIVSEDAKDLERIKELFNKMENLSWKSKEYNEAYSEYKKLINKHMTSKDILNTLSKKFNISASAYEIAMETASDTLEYIAYGEAYKNVSDDMQTVLRLMYYEVGQNILDSDEEGLMFIESLIQYEYLSQALEESIIAWEEYKEDTDMAVCSFVGQKVAEETVNQILDVAITSIMSKLPVLKNFAALREGLDTGMDFVDLLSNIDDYAYAGNMVGRLYYFTKVMYNVVDLCGDNLQGTDESNLDKAFYYASVFDEAVVMYRTTVCLASDYAIDFEEANLQSELGKLFCNQKKVSWYSSAVSMAATQKMLVEQPYCHNAEIKYDHIYKTFDFGTDLKIITVACPVSVTIKDTTGKKVAYLSDEAVDIEAGYEMYFRCIPINNGYAKIALVPQDYTISLSGSGTGTMNTYVASLQNYKIEKYQAFENIVVTEETRGYFEQKAEGSCDLIINDQKQSETTRSQSDGTDNDVYETANAITRNSITIAMNQSGYECYEGGAFTVKARITVPESYEYGSHKYIGYYAYLNKGNWEQIASWWIDGGEVVYPIKMTIHEWEKKGNNLFVISVFPVDNFATGGSLCDKTFYVNMLEEIPSNQDNEGLGSTSNNPVKKDYSNVTYVDVTLDSAGGNCSPLIITRRYLDIYDDLPVPTKEGYTFGGWYSEKNGMGKEKSWNSIIMEKTNHTLHAYWIKNDNNFGDSSDTGGSCIGNDDNFSKCQVTVNPKTFTYTGKFHTPTVIVMNGDKILLEGIDYDIQYKNNIEVGVAQVILTGKGDYAGSITEEFIITEAKKETKDFSKCQVIISSKTFTYTGGAHTPIVTIMDGNRILSEESDYTIQYVNNIKVGTAQIILTGIGTYAGNITENFTIKKASAVLTVDKHYKKIYGDQAFSLNVKKKVGGNLTYQTSDSKIAVVNSKGIVSIKGTGMAVITVKATETANYYAKSIKVTVTVVPKKQVLKSLKTAANRKLIVKWQKDTRASGYQIQYSTDKEFKKGVKSIVVKKNQNDSKTISGLKKGKKYSVRVRSYKKVQTNGKTKMLYGAWSTKKKSGKIRK